MNYLIVFVLIGFLSSCAWVNNENKATKIEVSYLAKDQQPLYAKLFMPEKQKFNQKLVIVIHGGSWQSLAGDMTEICEEISRNGFAALNVTYRFAPQFRYPTQLDDVAAALDWVLQSKNKYGFTDKIFVWGYSAGAQLAFNLSNLRPMDVNGVVVGGTPARFESWPDSPTIETLTGYKFTENPEVWKQASPVYNVHKNSPPTFIYHGQFDTVVEPDQAEALDAELTQNQVKHQYYKVSLFGHYLTYLFAYGAIERGIDFLNQL